jgi:hypothetical protein
VFRWDAASGTALGKPLAAGGPVSDLVGWTGPDGRSILAVLTADHTVSRWDATSGDILGTVQGAVVSMALLTDVAGAAVLALRHEAGTVCLVDATTGETRSDPHSDRRAP